MVGIINHLSATWVWLRHSAQVLLLIGFCVLIIAVSKTGWAQEAQKPLPREVVAVVPTHIPPQYQLNKNGQPVGFAIDIMQQVAQRAGLRVRYRVEKNWPATITALRRGHADLIPNLGISEKRSVYFAYTLPVETIPISIFVREISYDIKGVEDLAGKRVATVRSNIAIDLLKNHPGVKLVIFNSIEQALFALLRSDVDAFVYPMPWVKKLAIESGVAERIKTVGKPLIEVRRAIAVRKGDKELLVRLNQALSTFLVTKKYGQIYSKWYGKPKPYWTPDRILWLYSGVAGSLLLITIVGMGIWRYRSLVNINRQLAITIADSKLINDAHHRQHESIVRLNEWARKLLQHDGQLEKFYDLVNQGTLVLVNADVAALPLIDESGDTFTYMGAAGAKAELIKGKTLTLQDGGLCGWVAKHGMPLCVPNLADDPRAAQEFVRALDVNTGVVVPLLREDRIIGGLSAFRKGEPFDELDQQTLNLFAQQVSIVLDSLHLLLSLERRVAERTRELAAANVRLKELDQLKSMFIASMSHELRTPLNSIIGFTGVILQGMAGKITAKQQDQLTRVNTAAKHLLALISDVIDISKIEADKIDAFPETFDLNDLLEEAVMAVQAEMKKKGLDMEVSVPPGLKLHTDRKRLLQCLLNYLSNAVKFTPSGKISLTARDNGDELEITVRDTGIGIPEEDQGKLFRPFMRLESTLSFTTPGTGLGLYLTKKLVTGVLGGSVSLESHLGKGSTFRLRVPMSLGVVSSCQLTSEQGGGA